MESNRWLSGRGSDWKKEKEGKMDGRIKSLRSRKTEGGERGEGRSRERDQEEFLIVFSLSHERQRIN